MSEDTTECREPNEAFILFVFQMEIKVVVLNAIVIVKLKRKHAVCVSVFKVEAALLDAFFHFVLDVINLVVANKLNDFFEIGLLLDFP